MGSFTALFWWLWNWIISVETKTFVIELINCICAKRMVSHRNKDKQQLSWKLNHNLVEKIICFASQQSHDDEEKFSLFLKQNQTLDPLKQQH